MAIPVLILAGAGALGASGIYTGLGGTFKIIDAKKAVGFADSQYKKKQGEFDLQQRRLIYELNNLEFSKKQVQASFLRFTQAYEKIHNRPLFEEVKEDEIAFESISFKESKSISIKALELLGGSALTMIAAGATGGAVYGGAMTLGVASTGALISGLHGAAASNATLAFLGGGALKVGGHGMALGKIVLGGAAIGPAIAVTGLLIKAKASTSEEEAREIIIKVEEALYLLQDSMGYMNRLRHLSVLLRVNIQNLHKIYLERVAKLEELVERKIDYLEYTEEEKELVDSNILIVKYLAHLIRLPLVETDESGNEKIRTSELHKEIKQSKEQILIEG